jgi:hypothetical protein
MNGCGARFIPYSFCLAGPFFFLRSVWLPLIVTVSPIFRSPVTFTLEPRVTCHSPSSAAP